LEKGGHKVAQTDHAEGNPRTAPARYAEIGKHKHNKIYVKIGGAATEVDKLELFDAESLRTFGEKEGRALVAHKTVKEDKWDWSVEIHFIIAAGVVTAAELSVKATSDARAHIEVVPIKVDGLVLGEPKVIQTASFGKPDKAYPIPAPVREGPAYVPGKDFLPRTLHSSHTTARHDTTHTAHTG
jgi:acyl-CoA thioesterase